MVLHGLLHLIGFSREWTLGAQGQLTGKALIDPAGNTSKTTGIFWLLACILFLTAAILYLMRRDWYWILAVAGLVVSQILIIIYWQDAKYGTIVNVVIFVVTIFSAAAMHFNNMARREVKALIAQAAGSTEHTITEEMIAPLPANVQRWLRQSNVVGNKTPTLLRVLQKGKLRSAPDGRWMPFQSVQHFSISPPAFVWVARINAAPLIEIAGRDKYFQGRGNMLIKPLYLLTAADGSGKEIDQGTLLRYLAEVAWFPQAAVSPYLQWEGIDENRARVTMEYQGVSASGTYFFNEEGLVKGFEARRYGEFGGTYRKETWSVSITGHKTFNGVPIGHTNEVTWKLKEGDFAWLRMEVTEIQGVHSH